MTKALVYRRLMTSFRDACVVASVHRMGSLEHFDRIALTQDGRLIDVGTYDELVERQDLFRTMLQVQSHDSANALVNQS